MVTRQPRKLPSALRHLSGDGKRRTEEAECKPLFKSSLLLKLCLHLLSPEVTV